MLRRTRLVAEADRRTRHHMMLDNQINPREWFNWHMKEYQPWHFDRHKFLYEQIQWAHMHHLLCHQVYLKDMQQLTTRPEPRTHIIDTRMNTTKMHRWIPNSVWIPRDEVEHALQLTSEEFLNMYGVRKPEQDEDIVLISHNGLASEQAGWEFRKAFYTHVYNYRGGCNEIFAENYVDFPPVEKLKPWVYLPMQQSILLRHLDMWATKFPKGASPTEMRTFIREMNCETSQQVFIGHHLDNPVQFTKDYDTMTLGFLAPPIYFPGTALYRAVGARKAALVRLERAVVSSKKAMSQPNVEPTCLLDFWTIHILEEINNAKENGTEIANYAGDFEMAETLMDFLFASQDASTASLTMITATMKEHPDILQRVVKEQDRLRPNDEPLTFDLLQEMTFTRQCVLEQLRQYPPAPMVPMIAHAPFQIDENLTVPKGTLVIPSLVGACRDGFTNPESFDPDRMGEERQEDRKNPKSNLVFGVGPHRCVGYNYAINHLTVYLALVAKNMSWERTRTAKSDQIMYLPTLYPWDCLCNWGYRDGRTKAV
eukprot:GILI01006240.1.p1 GENE.GILI01006240.1~~GILI01006240.1.p1  ORF type:complete len:540 (+),score=136.70 GILI01006240.1:94-1713(+)